MKDKLRKSFTNYLVATLLLCAIFIVTTAANCGVKLNFLSVSYIVLSAICHSAIVMLLPGIINFILRLLLKKDNIAEIVFAVIAAIIQIVAIVDYFVFAFYRFHINGFVLSLLTGPSASQIFVFDISLILKSLAATASIIAINIFLILKSSKVIGDKKYRAWKPIMVLFLCVISANIMYAYYSASLNSAIIKCTEAIPYYYPTSANTNFNKYGFIDLQKIQQGKTNDGSLNYPKQELVWSDSITPPNIILIMIDAWSRRTFNEENTPHIFDFSNNCVKYTDHVSSSNGTKGSVFTIFTSLSSYYWQDFEMNNISPIFVDRLKTLGYNMQIFPSATIRNPAFNRVLFHVYPDIATETEGKTVYNRDCNLTMNFINYIDTAKLDKPVFAWLFYDLAHSYEMPEECLWKFQPSWKFADYTKLNRGIAPEPYFNLYQNAVYQIDSLVGMVLQKIEDKGFMDNSIIMICGDHSQEFNDNGKGYWGHNGNFSDVQIGTNLLWYSLDCQPQTVKYRTSHYDICPTILKQYLGLENPCEDFGSGKMLTDSTLRDWILVGSRNNFAFIHKTHIYEKRPSGYFFATDAQLNELPQDSIDYAGLNEHIHEIGSFYK